MTKEELLAKRYEVIADYPHNAYEVGVILIKDDETGELYSKEAGYGPSKLIVPESEAHKFPHLFKPLAWWQHRKIEDMPEYVKHVKIGCVNKSTRWEKELSESGWSADIDGIPMDVDLKEAIPATQQEYETFKNKR